jgi:hypothetical protein
VRLSPQAAPAGAVDRKFREARIFGRTRTNPGWTKISRHSGAPFDAARRRNVGLGSAIRGRHFLLLYLLLSLLRFLLLDGRDEGTEASRGWRV